MSARFTSASSKSSQQRYVQAKLSEQRGHYLSSNSISLADL